MARKTGPCTCLSISGLGLLGLVAAMIHGVQSIGWRELLPFATETEQLEQVLPVQIYDRPRRLFSAASAETADSPDRTWSPTCAASGHQSEVKVNPHRIP